MQAAGKNWRYGGGERIQLEKQAVDAETGAETGAAEDPIRRESLAKGGQRMEEGMGAECSKECE